MLYITEIIGTVFCLLSVILGAFGSHYLKNKMTQTEIQSFEIGVKYFGRTYSEGKKITWKDAFRAIYCIIWYNFFD